ncbi:WD40 repeat-like protein [Amylostereum chailletii]|nr:WD40 repeat-like protein [Amylostereum chailletii]
MSRSNRHLLNLARGPTPTADSSLILRARRGLIESYFDNGFPYSMKLSEHTSCVNALAFSRGDGRWMASAGDDRCVRLWDLHRENTSVASTFSGHSANIFTVDFSASNKYLISGALDDRVLKYNLEVDYASHVSAMPNDVFAQHSASIRAVSCHSFEDEVFLSASEDGSVVLHDGRAGSNPSRAQATLQADQEMTDVQYHPTAEHLFLTSDQAGNVCLRDTRLAFGPLRQRTRDGVVRKYITTLTRSSKGMARPDASSVCFNSDGTKFAVTFLHYLPTIYSVSDPVPIATCSGRNFPDGNPPPSGERTYKNATTVKHGSFGGPGDGYYTAGSDDFRGYIWKIPPASALVEQRETISDIDWNSASDPGAIAFTDPRHSSSIYVPMELSTPLFHLNGHHSIVNTALMHPTLPLIATAGIERHVVLHSPTASVPFSEGALNRTTTEIRHLPVTSAGARAQMRRLLLGTPGADPHDSGEEEAAIMLFDEILRTEGDADAFSSHPFVFSDSESDSDRDPPDEYDT